MKMVTPVAALVAGMSVSVMLAGCAVSTPQMPAAASPAPAVVAPAAISLPVEKSATVQVLEARFGLVKDAPDGSTVITPAQVVPLKPGQRYGWRLRISSPNPTVKVRSEYTLPRKPKTWGGEGEILTISKDRRTATSQSVVSTDTGVVEDEWSIDKGDPAGTHRFRIYLDDKLAREFSFTVR